MEWPPRNNRCLQESRSENYLLRLKFRFRCAHSFSRIRWRARCGLECRSRTQQSLRATRQPEPHPLRLLFQSIKYRFRADTPFHFDAACQGFQTTSTVPSRETNRGGTPTEGTRNELLLPERAQCSTTRGEMMGFSGKLPL